MNITPATCSHLDVSDDVNASHLVLLLRLQDGLEEGAALVAGGLLVEHARLDDLLVHVELVLGRRQDLLLHAVDGAEAEHAHLVLLADAVGAVLSLQVLEDEEQAEENKVSKWPFKIFFFFT